MVPVPPSLLHTTQPSRAQDRTGRQAALSLNTLSPYRKNTEQDAVLTCAWMSHLVHLRVDHEHAPGQAALVLHPDARALPTALLVGKENPARPSGWVMRVQGQTTGCGAPAQTITAGNCVPGFFQRCTQGWGLTRRPPACQTSESPSLSFLLLLPTLRTPARPPPAPCIGSAPFTQDSVRQPRATRYSARHLLCPPRALCLLHRTFFQARPPSPLSRRQSGLRFLVRKGKAKPKAPRPHASCICSFVSSIRTLAYVSL